MTDTENAPDDKNKPLVTREQSGNYVPEQPITMMVEENAVNRCQHSQKFNQCRYSVIPAQSYCEYHIALYNPKFRAANKLKKYRLTQHYARIEELAYGDNIKNLHEELGILNVLLETIWNQCHTPWDKQINQHKIESLVEKIGKTMQISHKLEAATGQVLDKNALSKFIDAILRIISDNVDDPEKLKRIAIGIKESYTTTIKEAGEAATKEMVD